MATTVSAIILTACQPGVDGLYVSCPSSDFYSHSITLENGEFQETGFRDLGGRFYHAGAFTRSESEIHFTVLRLSRKGLAEQAEEIAPVVYVREFRTIAGKPALGPITSFGVPEDLQPIDDIADGEVFIRAEKGRPPACPPDPDAA